MMGKSLRSGVQIALLAAGLTVAGLTAPAAGADIKTLKFANGPLSQRPDPFITGICVHFGIGGEYNYIPTKTAELVDEIGFDSFRDDLAWPVFDAPGTPPGVLRPTRLFDFMKLTKAKPLLILSHSNPAVDGGVKPMNEAGRTAYADFAVRAAAATRSSNPMFEIWNEWNLTGGQRPPWLVGAGVDSDPRAAAHYSALARTTIAALRTTEPTTTLLSGAVGSDPGWQWTQAIVRDGAIKNASGLSVHLYNHCEPDVRTRNATDIIDRLGDLQSRLRAQTGADVPIYLTEFGWPTARRPCVITQTAAADNIAQVLLWSAATPWMKGAWIYQLKDQGRSLDELEENFGLYDYNYNPKPAACAVREAIKLIKASTTFRLERPFRDVFILQATTPQGIRLVGWTTRAEAKGTLRLPNREPTRTKALCNAGPAPASNTIALGPEPVIVDLDAANVTIEVSQAP
ncbi:cellulase family glycosylhydrolase [Xanthobacter versatilis]